MKTIFKHTLLSLTLLAGAFTAQAQVKIGTAPTTIGTNNNLEVEATNNKKVIVHKNDGTVVIENTPLGAVTDSILSVDPAGNVRKIGAASIAPPAYHFEVSGPEQTIVDGQNTVAVTLPTDGAMIPSSAAADRDGNLWKAPVAGVYRVYISADLKCNNNVYAWGPMGIRLIVNGLWTDATAGANLVTRGPGPTWYRGQASVNLTRVVNLAAGETIGMVAGCCTGCGPSHYWFTPFMSVTRVQ